MRRHVSLLVFLTACASAPSALAATCYTLYDHNGNMLYRDARPPVDMSDEGAGARERMRARGESLVFMESDRCPVVTYVFGGAGSRSLTLDRVVGGLAPGEGVGTSPAPATPAKRRPMPPASATQR